MQGSEAMKCMFKHLKMRCKEQKEVVRLAKERLEKTKKYCVSKGEEGIILSAQIELEREEARLNQLVEDKISTEKFMKKLRHEEEEAKSVCLNNI